MNSPFIKNRFDLLTHMSTLWVPILLGLFTAVIIFTQDGLHTNILSNNLKIKVLEDENNTLKVSSALALLRQQKSVPHVDTGLSEAPFWILVTQTSAAKKRGILELPSRHMLSAECWDAKSLTALGKATREKSSGAISPTKAGFAINLDRYQLDTREVICKTLHSGPARITAIGRPHHELINSERDFYHGIGLLEGGLLTLALFTIVLAVLNSESRYLLLSVWLIFNIRMGGLSMGWDTQWLGRELPADWMPAVRKTSIAIYFLLTYSLFTYFLEKELNKSYFTWLLNAGKLSVVLLILVLPLPYQYYLPIMWCMVSFGIAVMVFFLARILLREQSRTAVWFSLALSIVLLASFAEVIAAAFNLKIIATAFNSVTAALASSVLVTLALAEQMQSEKERRIEAQEELNHTYESTPIGLFTLGEDGEFARFNSTLRQQLNIPASDEYPPPLSQFLSQEDWRAMQNVAEDDEGTELELEITPYGKDQPKWFLARTVRSGSMIEGSLQDISDRIEALNRLRFLANHDQLTAALNRHGLETTLETLLDESYGFAGALICVNLDRFKLVNDLYRSQAGDKVLKQVAERIKDVVDDQGVVGRLGGDEFLAILPRFPLSQAEDLASRIEKSLNRRPYSYGHQVFQVEASLGLIDIGKMTNVVDAISTAQMACREARETGKTSLVVYDQDAPAHRTRAEELYLIKLLGADTLPQGLHLVMQPILSLLDPHGSLNFEVLLRMSDPSGADIPVGKLLDAAETSGSMARLDKWVFERITKWLQENKDQLPNTSFVSVNLSGMSLNDPVFLTDLFDILERHHDIVHMLCIEITEGIALHDYDLTSQFIERLKNIGANVALDDFGAGYTSFSYLRSLQADALKIDGSFIQSIHRHPANAAIVGAIVELSANLGMRSIAEGVEESAMLEVLAEIGTDYIQGYLIARPQPLKTLLTCRSTADYITNPELIRLVNRLAEEKHQKETADMGSGMLYH